VYFFVGVINAQDYIPTPADISHFPETKTMIVLEDNPICEYNLTIKDFVSNEWKITPHDFLEFKNFEDKRKDKSLSFLILNRVTIEKDKSNTKYLFMSLLLGGDAKKLSSMPDMCSIPLAYYGASEETYVYKIELFLRFMQNHVKLISDNPKLASKNTVAYYNSNIQPLNGKTLYLIAGELDKDVNTEAKIKKVYNGPVKIVTKEEIQQAIKDKDPNVVILHKVGPEKKRDEARCYKILIGAADAQFYYFDYHKISDKAANGFLADDFKKLAKKK
jgi:hypothetical protein